jgi:hypothetical protein
MTNSAATKTNRVVGPCGKRASVRAKATGADEFQFRYDGWDFYVTPRTGAYFAVEVSR